MKNLPLYDAPTFVNVREIVEYIDKHYGGNIACSFRSNPHKEKIHVRTYERLAEDVRAIATAAVEHGYANGTHCALIGKLTYGWICTYLALLSVGAVLVPLDPDWSAEDLADTVKKAECTVLFCNDDVFAKKSETIASTAGIKDVITIDYAQSDCTLNSLLLEGMQLRASGNTAYETARISPDALALLVFTSGTTGKGKGVMLTQTAITSNVTGAMRLIDVPRGSRTVGVLPPHHTYGSTVGILAVFMFGSNMYLSSGVRYVVKELKEHKPYFMVLVPLYLETFYRKIKAALADSGKDKLISGMMKVTTPLSKIGIDLRAKLYKTVLAAFGGELKIVVSGGAPLASEIADTFEAFGLTILNGYGITECAPLLAANRTCQQVKGSVGFPVPGTRVIIKDPDENLEGEICAKGPNVMLGYYKDAEATAAAFDENGYFRTGDIGKFDENGWLYITGRAKNLIILSNGKNVYPEEIEVELAAVPGVIDVVVYEGQSRRGTEHNAIVAEIFPDAEYFEKNNIEDKQEYFKKYVNDFNRNAVAYKKISVLKVRETEFPKNTLRKIMRFQIDKTID
ncbi:MAG: AMP-binding protein [Clostridia bacterium]|nr:AMP-binding protein [Clostridia bacterium]